ncbi:MAG: gluconokinase [Gemmatimonadaceae bacterium]
MPPSALEAALDTGRYVVMGVSGAGKSLIGSRLARALGSDFAEGDDYHPPENVARMRSGTPLTDADRQGWLAALAARLLDARRAGKGLVIAASALKRSYRDLLRGGDPDVQFILLTAPRPLIAERLENRHGHYMPAVLLDSQLATLEIPSPDEGAWIYDAEQAPDEIIAQLTSRIRANMGARTAPRGVGKPPSEDDA